MPPSTLQWDLLGNTWDLLGIVWNLLGIVRNLVEARRLRRLRRQRPRLLGAHVEVGGRLRGVLGGFKGSAT